MWKLGNYTYYLVICWPRPPSGEWYSDRQKSSMLQREFMVLYMKFYILHFLAKSESLVIYQLMLALPDLYLA